MISLGVNSVLFVGHDLETAMKHIAWAGYDGIELSAIQGMCEHLNLDNWKSQVNEIQDLSQKYNLRLHAMEEAALDEDRLTKAFEAGQAIGIPVVNIGPGGKTGSDEDFERQTDLMEKMAQKAEAYGVTLCTKAHVGCCIDSTPTTLRAMAKIKSSAFGIDMDPSHIYRANENPEEALAPVLARTRHIHIRDCKGRGPSPGEPYLQANGRGDVNLAAYCKVMVEGQYNGPVDLEIIVANEYELARKVIIAAESYGYINAILKSLGAR